MNTEELNNLLHEGVTDTDLELEEFIYRFTETLCEKMQEKNISRTELAARLGKSKPWVTKLLSGDQNMTFKTIVTVLKELGYRAEIELKPISELEYQVEKNDTTITDAA
ncbi:MAG: helix-turn-helix domain-containing protein [Armatimonadota bacterium]